MCTGVNVSNAPVNCALHCAPIQGDVLVHLLEVAQDELVKRPGDISRPRLQSLLELAVRSSSCAGDPHADNLGYTFDPRSIMELMVAAQQQHQLVRLNTGSQCGIGGCGMEELSWWARIKEYQQVSTRWYGIDCKNTSDMFKSRCCMCSAAVLLFKDLASLHGHVLSCKPLQGCMLTSAYANA